MTPPPGKLDHGQTEGLMAVEGPGSVRVGSDLGGGRFWEDPSPSRVPGMEKGSAGYCPDMNWRVSSGCRICGNGKK